MKKKIIYAVFIILGLIIICGVIYTCNPNMFNSDLKITKITKMDYSITHVTATRKQGVLPEEAKSEYYFIANNKGIIIDVIVKEYYTEDSKLNQAYNKIKELVGSIRDNPRIRDGCIVYNLYMYNNKHVDEINTFFNSAENPVIEKI
ncbi:MAG: hypothetical protein PHP54_02790 [Clostridia bacterium]|nr:hypothetical protein [Clostridia bacterium]